jgi:hypothetical protein
MMIIIGRNLAGLGIARSDRIGPFYFHRAQVDLSVDARNPLRPCGRSGRLDLRTGRLARVRT